MNLPEIHKPPHDLRIVLTGARFVNFLFILVTTVVLCYKLFGLSCLVNIQVTYITNLTTFSVLRMDPSCKHQYSRR